MGRRGRALLTCVLFLSPLATGASPASGHIQHNARAHNLLARQSVPTALPTGWSSMGCFVDNPGSRTLSDASYTDTQRMSVEACISFCDQGGFIFAGVEFGQECYCSLQPPATAQTPLSDCSMACTGAPSETCGAGGRLNVFTNGRTPPPPPATNPGIGQWVYQGCFSDNPASRSLSVPMGIQGGSGVMSVAACTSACQSSNYPFAGIEFADECYCGTAMANSGANGPVSGTTPTQTGCSMTCSGNSSEFCGGPDRLNVYHFTGTLPGPPVTNPPPAGGGGGGGTSNVKPVVEGLPSPWKYSGCYVDNMFGRILSNQQPDNNGVTVESCISTCQGLGFALAGIEFSVQCFCGNQVINGGVLATSDTQCNMACGGNNAQACGGPGRMSIYASTDVVLLPVPTPQTTGLPGQWKYSGCIAEPGAQRVFPYQIIFEKNNTATNCLSLCSEYGYPAAGMEYSDECWCGDVEDVATNGGRVAAEQDCSMACSGDPIHLCGGPQRLQYYTWEGGLNTWHTPANTGHYEFLIGNLVIPLISTLGINDKVTFLEKWGTGPPNSTGAYELDVTLANDYTKAWREMHVKTDVFCAGSAILPDKAGRQLNVGGWSLDSTYGVRLFTPDGSLGVNGTNDWEEDFHVLKLQRGRWYPGVMVMANGSVLIVGGEEGSNGAPVPSLEILPKPPGGDTVLNMDWLQRTDPNNLYPFLSVLPGGGVLAIYYNEARILDERTFNTVKELPNLPAAVNNFLGGRTYPFEGTSVLLPQHAPYTDPLGVLVCGGSTPGPAIALDNCVSIQPEAPNAKWTIERMPSKRVMTCMVALPDGTYMILNGAQQGVAGFGLATEPNHRAILYDPSQPVGARMSLLGTTIVDRMYHSEAILLKDGRVLVSGSDPEDTRFVQEYRVEVYVPPYLTSGLRQPEFTIQNTDWAYGSQHQITVTLHQGTTANMRVSLLAAVSSTHGNSMGQRTIFPAFSCNGNTCTITAPPNAHVSPPGWFMLFVLDGPTPSHSQWVRIGGDPAGLGNWPNLPGFTRPGV